MSKSVRVIEVKGRRIGGDRPQICVPLVAKTEAELLKEASSIAALKPDLVEWRVDFLEVVESIPDVLDILLQLRNRLLEYPIIFTCRTHLEGGYRSIDENLRLELIKKAIKSGRIDMVDIELISGEKVIQDIIDTARLNHVYVILSNHDFQKTPPINTMVERLKKAQDLGADIAKIAVMPNSMEDVLNLLYATNSMKEQYAHIPIITMAMSGKGLITRIGGGIFGSAVTFGAGKAASAPGQIAKEELETAIEILYKNL